ncbi:hypothetical protein ES319_A11G017900v1 [Gossypium barbadense]|uniref:Uncharacterized protein n=1 Tax=Gossypium barbadense TaxID=3634 RepID=A0A5J5THK7_GOSBA|nr:hypothetical protein ES319_A11G017900v1 [Gossypium barbadense]
MSTNLCLMFVKYKRVGFSQYFQLRSFSVFTMHSSYTQLPCHPRGYIFVSWRELRFLNPKATSSRIVEQYIQAFSNIVKDVKGIYLGTYQCLLNLSFMPIDRVTTMLLPRSTTWLLKFSPCTKAQF